MSGSKPSDVNLLGIGRDFAENPLTTDNNMDFVHSVNVKDETVVKVVANNVVGDFVIEARLIAEETNTVLFVGTGTVTEVIDVCLFDRLSLRASTNLTSGTIAISGFEKCMVGSSSGGGGDATAANQVTGNNLLSQILTEVSDDVEYANIPEIVNFPINTANTINSIPLPTNTKKFMLRHRDRGKLEFAYDNGLTAYMTIPKGNTYVENDLLLVNQTLYFRSDKPGTVELLTWT